MKKFKMYTVNGGGNKYDGGLWEINETLKIISFKCIKKPFFVLNCPEKMRIKFKKEKSHCLRVWADDSYTVYPFQSGIPHIFEPI